ncbi:ATP/GTP-binding protein [Schumannella sp. 10F1B-5-1]|uniref:ATP/GTP-binding protein n=1 Tax=Schumannella sp. 10F1B-5-1 TaxID=2590780 RepID=UPI001131CC5A|nr:ATP/GTP-binding protein [Schumannella sp. 10F1B-5-1]TPW78400.1 ATP/GTP-binding protein [Schumannella sp. 10F1B-5-1]
MTTTDNQKKTVWNLPVLRLIAPPAPAAVPEPGEALLEQTPWGRPGSQLRVKPGRARRGFYGPKLAGAPTTTRQAEILNTATIGAPTGTAGIVTGRDVLSQTSIAHDPVTAYNATPRAVSSPNVVIVGDVGSGKSSHTKTSYVLRPLLLNKRRAVVFDRKDRGGEGEYSELARRFGAEPIRFTTDGTGTRVNLLDPLIAHGAGGQGQMRLLNVIVRLARDGQALTEWEEEALRAALTRTRATQDGNRTPVLADVLPNLSRVTDLPEYADLSPTAIDALHQAGLSVRFTLNSLLQDYAGLLDGETSKEVDLTGKLTSFDISQLDEDGPAVPAVMAIGHMWLLGRLRNDRGWATNCIYEEGWHIAAGPSAALARSNQKLSRGLALSNVFVFHKGTDIPDGSPSIAMLQEAQTVHVYRQSLHEDAAWCQRVFGFAPDAAERITQLRDGQRYDKIGSRPEIWVEHIRSPWETRLTNTDEAFEAVAN